jgi:hypothetical protein
MLTMVAGVMMPEAHEHGGKTVAMFTVLGYAMAAGLAAVG